MLVVNVGNATSTINFNALDKKGGYVFTGWCWWQAGLFWLYYFISGFRADVADGLPRSAKKS